MEGRATGSKLEQLLTAGRTITPSSGPSTVQQSGPAVGGDIDNATSPGCGSASGIVGTDNSTEAPFQNEKYKNPRKRLLNNVNATETEQSEREQAEKARKVAKTGSWHVQSDKNPGSNSKSEEDSLDEAHGINHYERNTNKGLLEGHSVKPIHVDEYMGAQIEKLLKMPSPPGRRWKTGNSDRKFRCKKCSKNFPSEDELKKHSLEHTDERTRSKERRDKKNTSDESSDAETQKKTSVKESETKRALKSNPECAECNMKFPSQEAFQRHVRMSHPELLKDSSIGAEKKGEEKGSRDDDQSEEEDSSVPPQLSLEVTSQESVQNAFSIISSGILAKGKNGSTDEAQKNQQNTKKSSTGASNKSPNRGRKGKGANVSERSGSTSGSTPKSKTNAQIPKSPSKEEAETVQTIEQPPTPSGRASLRRNIQKPKWLSDADLVTDYEVPRGTNSMRSGITPLVNGNQSRSVNTPSDTKKGSPSTAKSVSDKTKRRASPPSSADKQEEQRNNIVPKSKEITSRKASTDQKKLGIEVARSPSSSRSSAPGRESPAIDTNVNSTSPPAPVVKNEDGNNPYRSTRRTYSFMRRHSAEDVEDSSRKILSTAVAVLSLPNKIVEVNSAEGKKDTKKSSPKLVRSRSLKRTAKESPSPSPQSKSSDKGIEATANDLVKKKNKVTPDSSAKKSKGVSPKGKNKGATGGSQKNNKNTKEKLNNLLKEETPNVVEPTTTGISIISKQSSDSVECGLKISNLVDYANHANTINPGLGEDTNDKDIDISQNHINQPVSVESVDDSNAVELSMSDMPPSSTNESSEGKTDYIISSIITPSRDQDMPIANPSLSPSRNSAKTVGTSDFGSSLLSLAETASFADISDITFSNTNMGLTASTSSRSIDSQSASSLPTGSSIVDEAAIAEPSTEKVSSNEISSEEKGAEDVHKSLVSIPFSSELFKPSPQERSQPEEMKEMPTLFPQTISIVNCEEPRKVIEDVPSSCIINKRVPQQAPVLLKEPHQASSRFRNDIIDEDIPPETSTKSIEDETSNDDTNSKSMHLGELPLIEDESSGISPTRRDRSDSLSMRSCGSGSQSEKIKALDDTNEKNISSKNKLGDDEFHMDSLGRAVVESDSDSNDSLLSEFSELAAQVAEKTDGVKLKEECLHFIASKVSSKSMWAIRRELKRLKKQKNYFKFGKLTPLSAGLMHDLFCQALR